MVILFAMFLTDIVTVVPTAAPPDERLSTEAINGKAAGCAADVIVIAILLVSCVFLQTVSGRCHSYTTRLLYFLQTVNGRRHCYTSRLLC